MNNDICPIELWLQFNRRHKQIVNELEAVLSSGSHPLTLNDFYTLYYLNLTEGNILRVSDLSEKIGLSISATSRLLVRFENTCGVIVRQACETDKRESRIRLTELGKQRLAEASQLMATTLEKFRGQL